MSPDELKPKPDPKEESKPRPVSSKTMMAMAALAAVAGPIDLPRGKRDFLPSKQSTYLADMDSFMRHCSNHPPCKTQWKIALEGDPSGLCKRAKKLFDRTRKA